MTYDKVISGQYSYQRIKDEELISEEEKSIEHADILLVCLLAIFIVGYCFLIMYLMPRHYSSYDPVCLYGKMQDNGICLCDNWHGLTIHKVCNYQIKSYLVAMLCQFIPFCGLGYLYTNHNYLFIAELLLTVIYVIYLCIIYRDRDRYNRLHPNKIILFKIGGLTVLLWWFVSSMIFASNGYLDGEGYPLTI